MRGEAAIQVRFWGVRGSFPVPGPKTAKVGGNSSCVQIEAGAHTLIFDAGTGVIGLGEQLAARSNGARRVHIFLSHMHHDHIEGLRFFQPFYRQGWTCFVYGPESDDHPVKKALAHMMSPRFFPVELGDLQARIKVCGLRARQTLVFPGEPKVIVESVHIGAHPKFGVQLYKVSCGSRSVVYATDVESPLGGFDSVVELARDADVLIHDAQYTDHEYDRADDHRRGWGHSTVRMAAETARAAGVRQLILYHHDPSRTDIQVPKLEQVARTIFPRSRAAREGLTITLR
ncbi:MAG TPA: MBL fold metallo-hydrolase [Terriglobales bacterium]|nr:MBL fold metallo-hydrolase [Terriglobales bacterium]